MDGKPFSIENYLKSIADVNNGGTGGFNTNTDTNKNPWLGSGGYLDLGFKGVGTLANVYLGLQSLGLGKDQLKTSQNQFAMNWGAQAQAMNNENYDKWVGEYTFRGMSMPEAQYAASQRLKTEGIPTTIEEAKARYLSPAAPSNPTANIPVNVPNAVPTAQAPQQQQINLGKYNMNYGG